MNIRAVDGFTRGVAAQVSRRGSLLTLGAAAIGAATAPSGGDAKKKGQDCKKKAKQRCNNDAASCQVLAQTACENEPTCIATTTLCCGECSANGFLTCVLAASASSAVARLR